MGRGGGKRTTEGRKSEHESKTKGSTDSEYVGMVLEVMGEIIKLMGETGEVIGEAGEAMGETITGWNGGGNRCDEG